jgi:cation:H+ antiporter
VLPEFLESMALSDPWSYLAVFLGVSIVMLWRLEAMLDHGLEGTALGTLLMPYCSGLGNLIFVALMVVDVIAIMKALKGERWNIPLITDLASKF